VRRAAVYPPGSAAVDAVLRGGVVTVLGPSAGPAVPGDQGSHPAPVTRSLTGLLAADAVSTAGTEMTAVALPWFVLVSTGSPGKMGVALAAEYAGLTVLGLFGARVAGAWGPRRLMLAADLARAALIGAIPLLFWLGRLSFPVILAVAFTVGGFFPAYSSSQRILMAGLVEDDELRLTRVSGLMGAVNETASFAGPALGGILIALLGPQRVLVVDALSYLAAFLLVAVLVRAAGVEPDGSGEGGLFTGLRHIAGRSGLRRLVAGVAAINVGFTALVATLPVLALHDGGPAVAGWLLASYGLGSVVGGLLSSRARGTGARASIVAVCVLAPATWALPAPLPLWAVAVVVAITGVCAGVFFPRFFSALTTQTPPALRAHVMTSVTIAISVPAPLGFLAAGLLAQHTGSTSASFTLVAVATTLGAAVVAVALASRTVPGREAKPSLPVSS
jgi:MFS family permease